LESNIIPIEIFAPRWWRTVSNISRLCFNIETRQWAADTPNGSSSQYVLPKSGASYRGDSEKKQSPKRLDNKIRDPQPRGIKILIADDEHDLLDIFRRFLKNQGFDVITAQDGSEALAKFIESRPEVTVLDYRMPRSDGLQAASEILSMKSSAKIIMLTADGAVLEEAEKLGIELFLQKPVRLGELLDSVNTLIRLKSSTAIISR
jgi:CheY-like chemotaxis protein